MSDYQSPEFLTDVGNHSYTFEELSYHDKMKVKALEGLDRLASSLNAISNIKAIEFQLNHLNEMSDGFEAQLTEKDTQIATLQTSLTDMQAATAVQDAQDQETILQTQAQLVALQNQVTVLQSANTVLTAEVSSLKDQNSTLSDNFNRLKSVLTSIDEMTDEAID